MKIASLNIEEYIFLRIRKRVPGCSRKNISWFIKGNLTPGFNCIASYVLYDDDQQHFGKGLYSMYFAFACD